jgi:type II secretory pathway component PulF
MNQVMNDAPPLQMPERPWRLLATCLTMTHAIAWAPLLIFLIRVVPSYKKLFADFAMKLPELTMSILDLSDLVVDLGWIGVAAGVTVLVALDCLVLSLLLRYQRILGWLWFGLLVLGAILTLLGCWSVVHLPLVELMEGLAR